MATETITNRSWIFGQGTNDNVYFDCSDNNISFGNGGYYNNNMSKSKATIYLANIANYSSITLNYTGCYMNGLTGLYFGLYSDQWGDSYFYEDDEIVEEPLSTGDGSITISIPSDVSSGYLGFAHHDNSTDSSNCSNYTGLTITSIIAEYKKDEDDDGDDEIPEDIVVIFYLKYDANGGSGAPSSEEYEGDTYATISSIIPTRLGYTFLGWSELSSATSASYVAGDVIYLTGDITLYAVWSGETYMVTYDANGGSGAPSDQYKTHGTALTLSTTKPTKATVSADNYIVTFDANGGICSSESLEAERTISYSFSQWNTNSNGTGTSYNPGTSYTEDAALQLYAIYTSSASTESIILPTPIRDGYKFLGWSADAYDIGGITGEYIPTDNIVLYAIWKPMGLVYIYDDSGDFCPYQIFICDGSGWNQYIPYIYNGSSWDLYS